MSQHIKNGMVEINFFSKEVDSVKQAFWRPRQKGCLTGA
jgi:hypothetical protein